MRSYSACPKSAPDWNARGWDDIWQQRLNLLKHQLTLLSGEVLQRQPQISSRLDDSFLGSIVYWSDSSYHIAAVCGDNWYARDIPLGLDTDRIYRVYDADNIDIQEMLYGVGLLSHDDNHLSFILSAADWHPAIQETVRQLRPLIC